MRGRLAAIVLLSVALVGCGESEGDDLDRTMLFAGGPHPEPPLVPGATPAATPTPPASPSEPVQPGAPAIPGGSGEPGEPSTPTDGDQPQTGEGPDAGVGGSAMEVDPCGDDPEADAGRVRPDYGSSLDGAPFSTDPVLDGPFGVLRLDANVPNPDGARPDLAVTFYAPTSDGSGSVGDALPGPLPLVLVMHGFATNHVLYEHFSNHLASHGLLVVGITLPGALVAEHDKNAAEAIAVIDYALGPNAPAAARGRADAGRVAVAGHSMGGKIGFFAAALDPRIDIVIGWDPSNAGGPPCFLGDACNAFPVAPNCLAMDAGVLVGMQAESLIFRAAPDAANPEAAHNAVHFFRGAPAPATLIDYDTSALHGDWASAGALPIEHTKRVQLALLLQRFTGATGLEDWLPGGARIGDGAGVQRVLYK